MKRKIQAVVDIELEILHFKLLLTLLSRSENES